MIVLLSRKQFSMKKKRETDVSKMSDDALNSRSARQLAASRNTKNSKAVREQNLQAGLAALEESERRIMERG